ncbi:MAG: GNAT family N-acetyltransferase [Nostoc sp. ChiSLP02]|nr:GNAT family N-acetyltransferase [Nostoc sp. DedSLP05]MDZ8102851.1 GNAT family N-acetyltransferase [Nostoc sp. DedSLP01]MDZ8184138.1 GNAT family N-acetyltransferase [Nostoc sp. ChiSLP02]
MSIEIIEVNNSRKKRLFFEYNYQLYKNDPYWVSWPATDLVKMFEPEQCPFYQHGIVEAWLAYQNGKIVGRIAGSIDRTYNQTYDTQTAFFGFYECIDDLDVSKKLFEQVENWAKFHGMTQLLGPFSLSPIYGAGMLVAGFDDIPYVAMPYNQSYYPNQLESLGFKKAKDYRAFRIQGELTIPEFLTKNAQRWRNKRITYRQLNLYKLAQESNLLCDLYNDAFAGEWGYICIEPLEFYQLVLDWVKVIDPRLFLFVLVDGNPVGFGMLIPDVFQTMHESKTLVGLLRYLGRRIFTLGRENGITRYRLDNLCIRKKYQSLGLGVLLWWQIMQQYLASNYSEIEFSPILEDNIMAQTLLLKLEAKRSKVYRVFEKSWCN